MEKSQIATDCLDLIFKMLNKEITTEQKYLGMMELHKKYPEAGFYQQAQKFADRWLRKKVVQKPELHLVRDKKLESTGEHEDEVPF